MIPLVKVWLLTAAGFFTALLVRDWLGSAAYLTPVTAAAAATIVAIAWPREQRGEPALSIARRTQGERGGTTHRQLPSSELKLAVEHIQSILVLLQISADHKQPVPRAVLVNLDLVLKNLTKLTGDAPSAWEASKTATTRVAAPSAAAAEI